MSKRRTITITEGEFKALATAIVLYEAEIIENLEAGSLDLGVTQSTANRQHKAMMKVISKWHEAGRKQQ